MKKTITEKIKANFFIPNILYVLFAGLIVRLALSSFGTLSLDHGTFVAWSMNLAQNGFRDFYSGWSDYLPGYLYVLGLLGKINSLGIVSQVILYKLPAILADLATGFFIYKIIEKSKGEKWGLMGAAIYIFNPAILGNSTLWGQVDSLTALASVLTIYTFGRFPILSAVFLSVGTLIKPQAAFILPVILYLMVKNRWNFTKFILYGLTSFSVFVLGFLPFLSGKNLAAFIMERLGLSFNQYPYTSLNAFNFWGFVGTWKPDNIYFQIGGYVLVLILLLFLFVKARKIKNPEYYFLSFIFSASFIFFTRMHERHLLPVFAPLAIIAIENPIFLIPYLGFSLTYTTNLYYAYIWITDNFRQVIPDFFVKCISLLNVGMAVFIFTAIIKNLHTTWKDVVFFLRRVFTSKKENKTVHLPVIQLSKKGRNIILISIISFAFLTRTLNLGSPPKEYFDEVYHAFTARVILHGDPKAWEWWNTPPEGFAYEWTHPPLAKLGMVLGMFIFGENSFGWRIPGALLGVGSIFLIYLLAKTIFKDEVIGLLSAGAFSLDGLALVLSRIGMNDSYILFFSLLSLYQFLKQKDLLSALSFGLALSSKWSAIWVIPILFILWWREKKRFRKSLLWFIFLPPVIYLLSYLPMFLTGHDLTIWWGMQKQMWWYHTGLRATHAYSSAWWSWPFLIRPIYLYTSDEIGGFVARIYAMGNPFVFWFGIASVAISAIVAYIERNKNLGLVVFSYLVFFVPWAASPRIMFLYHYLPSVPFMCMAVGYILRRFPKLILGSLTLGLLVFIYFYPHWIGLQVPLWLDSSYDWLSTWR